MEVASAARGSRRVYMGEGFFTGYRRNIIEPDELLVNIFIPRTKRDQYFIAYKQAKRRDDDIAIVNMALNVTFEAQSDIVQNIHIAYGGMAPTVVLVPETCSRIMGKKWDRKLLEIVCDRLMEELGLPPNAPGGMILYRRSLTMSLFFKAFLEVSTSLDMYVDGRHQIPERERSGSHVFHTLVPKKSQIFQRVPDSHLPDDVVGKPIVHMSAYKQATGEAVYCDDMPKFENELYLALVLSTRAHAKLLSIDAAEALRLPGIHAFFSAKDLTPDQNQMGAIYKDEEVFVSTKVTSHGMTIGAIVGDNQKIAQAAARLVKVEYEDIMPIIVTIEDAVALNSFFTNRPPRCINKGDVDRAMCEADITFSGECRMGGQEHFYLETHVTIAVPRDSDELELYSSTQNLAYLQASVAHMTGLSASRIFCKVKRLGGGFGGKETRGLLVALPVALAANRLGRPVRCMLDRDEDMAITGTRHPFYFKYKVAATKEGKLIGLDIQIYNNGGYSTDYSYEVNILISISMTLGTKIYCNIFKRSWIKPYSTALTRMRYRTCGQLAGCVKQIYHQTQHFVDLVHLRQCSLLRT